MRGPGNRDDLPTLRVTNISEDTQENDLRELFGVFGRVARVYVGRDRETGAGKGFAFVSFEDKAAAQKAIDKVNGRGYDNLILSVQWSRKFIVCSLAMHSLTEIAAQNHVLTGGRHQRQHDRLIPGIYIFSGRISLANGQSQKSSRSSTCHSYF